ncbi:hypothetical protein ALQ18_00053 [Pseudomonas marginalis pv. marginalis]|nr:hypothetical protein ALQ18_00053 [Pseudomonas marginalis pv. marginalis]
MAVGGFFPLGAEVPVVGNVVVIENHQRREVRKHPCNTGQPITETVDLHLLTGITRLFFGAQCRRLQGDQRPGRGRPDQYVHRDHFGKGHQVVVGGATGENRLFYATKKTFAQGLVAVQRGQQVGAIVIAGAMPIEVGAVIHHRAFQVFVEQPEARDQCMNRAQHRPGHIVGVDLVAAHHQQRRAFGQRVCVGQQAVDAQQAFVRCVVGFTARAMHQLVQAAVQHERRGGRFGIQQVRRPFGDAEVIDQQVIADHHVQRQSVVQRHVDQVDEGVAPHRYYLALALVQLNFAGVFANVQPQGWRQFTGCHQPQHQAFGFQSPQQRPNNNGGQGACLTHREDGSVQIKHPA